MAKSILKDDKAISFINRNSFVVLTDNFLLDLMSNLSTMKVKKYKYLKLSICMRNITQAIGKEK